MRPLLCLRALGLLALASCAPAAPSSTPNDTVVLPPIAAVHRARCGNCHVRVEPGERTRDALTVALARHRTRVHLSDADWTALVDYLAPERR